MKLRKPIPFNFRTISMTWFSWIFLTSFLLILQSVHSEGTRQLEPSNPSTTPNRRTRIMLDQTGGSAHRTPFATIGCAERYRLNVYITDPANEKIYFGFNDGTNTIYYQIKDPDGVIVAGFSLAQVPASGAGYITTWDQAYAGPKIGTINPTGYDPKILTPTKVGNYYVEFAPNLTGGSFTGQDMLYFDISVVNGTTIINGRLWSKAWQLSDANSGDIVLSYPAKLYIYTDDGIVTQLNINEWNGGTYTTYCNQWGISSTGNWTSDRMSSSSWPGSDLPQYKLFLNNPDINIFPTGDFGEICEVISQPNCNGSVKILVRVNKPGSLTLNLDIDPPGTGPEDVVLTSGVNGSAACDVWDTIFWNGLNGLGNPVQNGTNVNIDIDYLNGLTNLPLWDVEDNAAGLIVNLIRPVPAFSSKVPVFWDDSNLTGGTVNSVNGCIYPTSINVSGCHHWASQDENMINTWWYLSEGSTNLEIVVIRNPVANFSFVNTCSGSETQFNDETFVPGGYSTAWKWTFGLFGDTSSLQNPLYSFPNSGTYQVNLRVTSNAGCVGITTKPVVIHSSPVADAGTDKLIPFGTNTTLQGTASGGSGNYSWHWEPAALLVDPNVPNPTTVELSETADFTLTVTDLDNLCQDSDVITVTIIGGPLGVQLSADAMSVCRGASTLINAQVGGGSGTYSYTWSSDPPGFSSNLEDITVQPQVTTTYTLVTSDGFSTLTRSITISVYPDPVAYAGSPQTIPYGTSTLLTGYATTGVPPITYSWSPPGMLLSPAQSNTQTVLLYNTTNFILTITDGNGCSASSTVMITISGGPLQVSPQAVNSPICKGESASLLPMSEGGSGNYSYTWTGPDGFMSTQAQPVVTPAQTTTYHLVVSDGYTQTEGDVTVIVNPLPFVNLIPPGAHILSGDTILACVFDTLVINAENANSSYLWSHGATTPQVLAATTGIAFDILTFSVTVTNTLTTCSDTGNLTVIFTYAECTYGIEGKDPDNGIQIYPNPGDGIFTCNYSAQGNSPTVVLSNALGKEIWQRRLTAAEITCQEFLVNLTGQPSGVYLLRIKDNGYQGVLKIIKL